MKKYIAFIILLSSAWAQEMGSYKKGRTIYKYRKYQKFDFENLTIDGERGLPEALSVSRGNRFKYKNRLPYRKNFNPEIKKGIERIR